LSALAAFYQHQLRHGVDVGELLSTWQPPGPRGGWKPFLHHIAKDKPQPRRTIALKVPRKLPRVLTVGEVQSLLDGCTRLRDRFMLAVLHDSGCRIGEALGLRHEDLAAAEREITITPRLNDNGARSKSRHPRTIPVSAALIRLYGDYLHGEYGELDLLTELSELFLLLSGGVTQRDAMVARRDQTGRCRAGPGDGRCPDGRVFGGHRRGVGAVSAC
jgi:integrase